MKNRFDPSHHERTLLPRSYISLIHIQTKHLGVSTGNPVTGFLLFSFSFIRGARCSTVIERPLMVRWVVGSISHSIQCSTIRVTNDVVRTVLSVGKVHIKDPLLLIETKPTKWRQRISSLYLRGHLPYVQRHITANKMCFVHH